MNKKNILEQIKELFSTENEDNTEAVENTETVEVSFVDVTTEDGRLMRAQALEVGEAVVEIIDEEEVAVENGDYLLEDGRVLEVSDGLIAAINEVTEEEEEEVEVDETFEAIKLLFDATNGKIQTLENRITELEDDKKELTDRFNKMAGLPSENPTNTKVEFKTQSKEDKLKFFATK